MAKEPKHPNAPRIEFDALAETMVPDPATIPDSVALAEFVGRSAEDERFRLYVDVSFRAYYEISNRILSTVSNFRRRNLPWEDRSSTSKAALLCDECRFQRKSKPGSYRARCRVSARGPPVRLLWPA